MRISTSQTFDSALQNMLTQQARLLQTQNQVGTGLRVLTPADDPAASVRVADIESNLAVIGQYRANAVAAENQLGLEDITLSNVNNILQRASELTVQAANGSNSDQSRGAIAAELRERLNELVDLANTRDAAGEYIFAGNNVTSQPFTASGSTVSYGGDQAQRLLQVGEGTRVAVRDSGARVFMSVPSGNGRIDAQVDGGNAGTLVVNGYSATGSFTPDNYTLSFSQPTPTDPITYSVTDGAAVVVASGTWVEGDSIQFAGIQMNFVGVPANGDSVTIAPAGRRDMFSIVEDLVSALEAPRSNPQAGAVQQNAINKALSELDQALTHVSDVRASVGARLNVVDSQRSINEDFEFQLQTSLSETRDLDYAEAISRFNEQLVSLQAAQQTYVRIQDLSLFNLL